MTFALLLLNFIWAGIVGIYAAKAVQTKKDDAEFKRRFLDMLDVLSSALRDIADKGQDRVRDASRDPV